MVGHLVRRAWRRQVLVFFRMMGGALRPRLDESSPTKNGKIFPLRLQNMSSFT